MISDTESIRYGIELEIVTDAEHILLEAILDDMKLRSLGATQRLRDAILKYNELKEADLMEDGPSEEDRKKLEYLLKPPRVTILEGANVEWAYAKLKKAWGIE